MQYAQQKEAFVEAIDIKVFVSCNGNDLLNSSELSPWNYAKLDNIRGFV